MQRQLLALFSLGIACVCIGVARAGSVPCIEPHFKCKNDRCISKSFVCDGEDDCGDKSDELHCKPRPKPCKSSEWQCGDKAHCIDLDDFCDGKKDCLDASDEYDGCYVNKTCKEFKCSSGQCISRKWICDGMKDCADGSDELDCDSLPILPENCNNTIGKYLCDNKRCISLASVCDGVNNCGDNSDEGPAQCARAKAYCSHPTVGFCSHVCSPTPRGSQCSCRPGFVLNKKNVCEVVATTYTLYARSRCLGREEKKIKNPTSSSLAAPERVHHNL
ncbi:very low-density lipoprotein receptor-like [Copidosoma floridanum]|uniref:very low-density lipoprotein receptor-like n=1 Tax=Copidosoma floridanum TaxID=29053 RepID=UPI000C6FAE6A|nr:very low-density lipoprotein receptor-like [Copidosoma floridanum]